MLNYWVKSIEQAASKRQQQCKQDWLELCAREGHSPDSVEVAMYDEETKPNQEWLWNEALRLEPKQD